MTIDKKFAGFLITHDEDLNYFIDQHRMTDSMIKEANISGDEHLPYPTNAVQAELTRKDYVITSDAILHCSKYPYRRVVGQLIYEIVHTMVPVMYALKHPLKI